ncbi:MAG: rRNA large subunit methyltransferase [Bacilli bacterium]|nr:rRNA large subunit methyltransferase [Bacilli bacterium]
MAKAVLTARRKKRLEQGNPWVYQNEIDRMEGTANPGDVVDIYNHQGHFLAKGSYNPNSQICIRVLAYDQKEQINQSFFEKRFRAALDLRRRFLDDVNAFRVIYGEADFLPGLIVDKYADVLVIQVLSLGMEVFKKEIVQGLRNVLQPQGIFERSDVKVRELEGLAQTTGWLLQPDHEQLLAGKVEIRENGLKLVVDFIHGQKTGYFFDQRENRAAIAPLVRFAVDEKPRVDQRFRPEELAQLSNEGQTVKGTRRGADVLECFSHTGSFTVHAAAYGANSVTCLDISELAIDTAIQNVKLNGFEERAQFEFVVADAFEQLRSWSEEGRLWDVVMLDPPAFAKSKQAVQGACRGYKEINLRGMKLVKNGGYLVTSSCSYHISAELFQGVIAQAAVDARKILRLIDFRTAGKDHPQLLGVDEGNYLKFAIFEVTDRG